MKIRAASGIIKVFVPVRAGDIVDAAQDACCTRPGGCPMLGVHHSVIFFIRGYRKGNGEPTFCVVSPNTGGKEEVRKATNQADRREVNPRSRCQVLHHLKKLNSEQEVLFVENLSARKGLETHSFRGSHGSAEWG